MNKCDLEETKHAACQKFLELVYSDDKRWETEATVSYTEHGAYVGPPYYFKRGTFASRKGYYEVRVGHYLVWSLLEKTESSDFDVKMAAACEELQSRYYNWQKQLQCEAILAAMNPKPVEKKTSPQARSTSFISKIKRFWKGTE